MKRIISLMLTLIMAALLCLPASAEYEPDYMTKMMESAVGGDVYSGRIFAQRRNDKIDDLGLDYQKIEFDELYLLSKIMHAEAGSTWLSDLWKMCVGEVALNRVASPEFPSTLSAVLYQPGQYYGSNSSYFNNLRPSERCVALAKRLLEGERNMHTSVVFQANFRQGSGVHTAFYDSYLGWTYFCYSSRPSLYW